MVLKKVIGECDGQVLERLEVLCRARFTGSRGVADNLPLVWYQRMYSLMLLGTRLRRARRQEFLGYRRNLNYFQYHGPRFLVQV